MPSTGLRVFQHSEVNSMGRGLATSVARLGTLYGGITVKFVSGKGILPIPDKLKKRILNLEFCRNERADDRILAGGRMRHSQKRPYTATSSNGSSD